MVKPAGDERLARLELPIRSVGIEQHCSLCDHTAISSPAFGRLEISSSRGGLPIQADFSIIPVGDLALLSGRVSPLVCREEGEDRLSLCLCFGGMLSYREQGARLAAHQGQAILHRRQGGELEGHYLSSIHLVLPEEALRRAIRSIAMGDDLPLQHLQPTQFDRRDKRDGGLYSLMGHLDALLEQSHYIVERMSIDDQIIRGVAYALLQAHDLSERVAKRWEQQAQQWSPVLDDLVDYIRHNAQFNLSLTDLEQFSHYSARHLQTLFRSKLNCTPMQFVRRQRLAAAMDKLQSAEAATTVTRIARDCGYRHISTFTADFQQEFGVRPSVVLRAAQAEGSRTTSRDRRRPQKSAPEGALDLDSKGSGSDMDRAGDQ